MSWDVVSDTKATALMSIEMDALDLRDSVKKLRFPVLVLGSWQGWDSVKTEPEVKQRYQAEWAPAKQLTLVFSTHGKHFLMYEDYDWMIAQMDMFLRRRYRS